MSVSQLQSPLQDIADLLSEGLDLCVRARKLDNQERANASADLGMTDEGCLEQYGTTSGTVWLWTQQQYDDDLAVWETRAKNALIKHGLIK